MKTLDDCYDEITRGEDFNVDLMSLALQLQRNDVLADIEERLEILNMKMEDVAKKIDEISYWKSLER
mgnify:CR=1 FL=1|tara:strand:+ start:939 stop:1139 length:201 start_codon:yes stop_codon:yes gene_type:complete